MTSHKKNHKQPITSKNILKIVVTLCAGITAIIVLFITINTVIKPFYIIQDNIEDMSQAIKQNANTTSDLYSDASIAQGDMLIIAKVLHVLLRNAAQDTVTKDDLIEMLQYYEDVTIYDTANLDNKIGYQ